MKPAIPLIIHIPHASACIPYMDGYLAGPGIIDEEIKKLTDWFTDELFHFPEMHNDEIVADFSRVFCDVERFEDDADEPMAKRGMGVLYTTTDEGAPLREVTPQLRKRIITDFYRPHHQRLFQAVASHLQKYEQARIIDAHSFSDTPFRRDSDQEAHRPDFCIGTDRFHTPKEWIDFSIAYFRDKGYSLAINRPYAGTIVPLDHLGKEARVKSIMLEVNRKLYLNNAGDERSEAFPEVKATIEGFLKRIRRCDHY